MGRNHKSTMTTTTATYRVVTPDETITSASITIAGRFSDKEALARAIKKALPVGYVFLKLTEVKEELALYIYDDDVILKYGTRATPEQEKAYFANRVTEEE